ncbi:MAG: glycoside hydrolase family 127 protein [Clostridia bacterium]|nr:glycoside hydrolase family 127 protein [Clostridia bacterium]
MKNRFVIENSFFGKYQNLVRKKMIPYQRKVLDDAVPGVEKSHAIENFRIAAGLSEGEHYGWVFQDSDLGKWIEAASYSLMLEPDPELEADMDALIEIIGKAQMEDGYLDTYFIIGRQDKRWTNLQEAHELYCTGHMLEAAVAHYEATGKTSLLDIMEKNVEHIINTFGKDKKRGFPGHPEIELALVRLYKLTGKEKYLELVKYFVDERGTEPNFFEAESKERGWTVWRSNALDQKYTQNHAPVREQKDAVGHAVRAVYLYTGMAGVAMETGDKTLIDACHTLWKSITRKRMFVTGGIGSVDNGEAFSADYDLNNDTAYSESCAAIGLIFFAKKMLEMEKKSEYADVMERALYNTVLGGMSLDGKNFFYVNPLEVNPEYAGKVMNYLHVEPVRPSWFGCACCPPNIARMLTSLNRYVFDETEDTLYNHLFIGGELDLADGASLEVKTGYPYDGNIVYTFNGDYNRNLAVRIPDWSKSFRIELNGVEIKPEIVDGYAVIKAPFAAGDEVKLILDMTPRKIYPNVLIRDDEGAVAVQRGPFVYCLEGVDNDGELRNIRIPKNAEIKVLDFEPETLEGIVPLEVDGVRLTSSESLYSYDSRPTETAVKLRMIPYYAWANRGVNQMQVWTKEI